MIIMIAFKSCFQALLSVSSRAPYGEGSTERVDGYVLEWDTRTGRGTTLLRSFAVN